MARATATINGELVAETDTWEVVDGNIYVRPPPLILPSSPPPSILPSSLIPTPNTNIHNPKFPPSSLQSSSFTPTSTHTTCPYKGKASYYTISTGKTEVKDAAWFYPEPKKGFEKIRDYVAFYKGKPGVEVSSG